MDRQDRPSTIPLEVAARRLQTTSLNVLMHVRRGILQGEEVPGGWRIEVESLAALLLQRAQGGSLTLCKSGCSSSGGCGSGACINP